MAAEAGLKLAPEGEEGGGETDEAGEAGTEELDADASDETEESLPDGDGAAHGESAAESTEEQAESKT
jgi:hypothetical protein